jgi:hypothetical protein
MQAIQTKYIGPSNVRGTRYKATCAAGSVTVGIDYRVGFEENHKLAAMALCSKLNWDGVRVGGTLKDGTMVWVIADDVSCQFETAYELRE